MVRGMGIIPARAGFTPPSTTALPPRTDHPRSRGVYLAEMLAREPWPGSSPLARGLRVSLPGWYVDSGIIPARAGFTMNNIETITRG